MRRRKSKFTKLEICNRAIRLWEERQEAADRMIHKSVATLIKLRRERERLMKRATTESKVSDELITSVADAMPPIEAKPEAVTLDTLGETAIGKANAESWNQVPAIRQARKRKAKVSADVTDIPLSEMLGHDLAMPKAGDPGPALLAEMLPQVAAHADRAAKMEALGFRKTGKRR